MGESRYRDARTVSVGGFILRLAKGEPHRTRADARERRSVASQSVFVRASARVLLVKSLRLDLDYSYSNYKKFQVDSRVVSPAQ